MSDEKCLFCFPLDCGVLTLGILSVVSTVAFVVTSLVVETKAWDILWPFAVCYGLMSVMWIIALAGQHNKDARALAVLGWVSLVVLVAPVYEICIIANGSLEAHICHESFVEQINETTGATEQITVEDCKFGGMTLVIIDFIVRTILNIYFTTVILRWANIKNDDDYSEE